jgi:hypothetical protein
MADIAADVVVADQARVARTWRTTAVLVLLGVLSFAAVCDQTGERRECGAFILGQSLLGGCAWLE